MTVGERGRGRKRRLLVLGLVVAAFVGLVWYVRTYVTIDELVVREQQMRTAIENYPWRSFAIGLALYTVVSLVPGTSGKSVIFGWLFGMWQAVIMILAGLTAAGLAMFFLSRFIFRAEIEHRYGKFLGALNRHLEREGAFYLLTLRMAHFPYSIVNLASGASRVRARTFCWTTAVGLLPGTLVFAWVGVQLPSLEEIARNGVESLIYTPIIAALAVSAVFPLLVRCVARRLGVLRRTDSPHHLPET
jgi:uncharacterized membrane protein YdjX (TVP38/TMEM64 family)